MSKLSIFETSWIDLVFQYRNKEYGAYQLRKDSTKTSLYALLMGMLLLVTLISVPVIASHFKSKTPLVLPNLEKTIVTVSTIIPNEIQEIIAPVLPQAKANVPQAVINSEQLVDPEIVSHDQATQEVAKNTDNSFAASQSTEVTSTVAINPTPAAAQGTLGQAPAETTNTIVTTASLDKLPEFPGGINKFYTYVGNNFEKPELDSSGNIKVFVSFVIEKDGSMTDIQVKRDPGFGLGKEAIRVLKSLKTKWTPGMIGSQAVRTAYNLPIIIQMN